MRSLKSVAAACAVAGLPFALALATEAPGERERHQAIRHYRQGQEQLAREAFAEAEAEFRQAIRLDRLLTAAHYSLGQVKMATREYPAAIRAYLDCQQAFLDEYKERLLDSAAAERRLDEQIRALEDVLRSLSSGRVTAGPGGQLQSQTIGKYENQLSELKRRRERGTEGPPTIPAGVSLALGSAYFRAEQLADAEREYKAALVADAKLAEAHNNLAVVYLRLGRLDEAQRELELAESGGFKVHPGLKQSLAERLKAQARKP